ncbi:MAG: alpha/beta fold hydrolase [Candidatus Acidiferrales bacterium]
MVLAWMLGGFLALGLLLALGGLLYQAVGSARDWRRYPPPGKLSDVGGHRLHLYTMGEGTPTVVLDSGLPGTCLSWALVQPEVAQFARVCSYDRAGLGWSDPGPRPRTSQQIVTELHRLLQRAGLEPPYMLVGHSFGSFTVRLYASQYPDEVAGLVLVDPISTREWLEMTPEQQAGLRGGVRMARYGAVLARLGVARLISFLARIGAVNVARLSVKVVTAGRVRGGEQMVSPIAKLPPESRAAARAFWTQPKCFETIADQVASLAESAAQVAAADNYGELPLLVLSASNSTPARLADREALAALSSRGTHRVAPDSGHWIQLEQPQQVIDAIREVVLKARGPSASQ